jgi:hypothetical protein
MLATSGRLEWLQILYLNNKQAMRAHGRLRLQTNYCGLSK